MSTYELESVDLPKLSGRKLRAVARMLEGRFPGGAALAHLMEQGGLTKLRDLRLFDPPTFVPIGDASDTSGDHATVPGSYPEGEPGGPFCTGSALARAFRDGSADPVGVAESAVAAIAASDEGELPLRAFIASDADDVLRQAEASKERHRRGEPLSALDGIPIAIKDEIHQVPYPTTAGTGFLNEPATEDSTVVARLRRAGAVLLGKANMHEIGINPNGLNVHHGVVRNPYDRTRDSGGSSSGSAAAVAAGLCPIAIGADGGGSIRVPASLCGLVGLKPTFGRISEHGAQAICWTVTHLGPIATSVDDAELAYLAVAGPDPADRNTVTQPPVRASERGADLSGVTLGVYRPWFEHADADTVKANEEMLRLLTDAGARVEDVEIPELNEMRIAQAVTILSEMVAAMRSHQVPHHAFGPTVRVNLAVGRAFTADDYVRAQQVRTRAMRIFASLFQQVDAILSPTSAITAPTLPTNPLPHGWSDLTTVTELMRYAVPANVTGIPALTFPAGYTAAGLPIGTQVMAAHWREELLFRIARVAEGSVARQTPERYHRVLP